MSANKEHLPRISSNADEARGNLGRAKARLAVFETVYDNQDPETAFPTYESHEKLVVATGFDRWQTRVTNKEEIPSKRQVEVRRLFEKDVTIARRFQSGVEINGEIISLKDLIAEKYDEIETIKTRGLT